MSHNVNRRAFLKASATLAGLAAAQHTLPAWMPRLAFAQPYNNPRGDVLVVIFLRGGADSMNMIVPYAEDAYYTARPTLAIPRPDANTGAKALDLDGFFGLHPALAPLLPIFQGGGMTAVHAAGSPHATRSHFEAMSFMERGTPGSYDVTTGWVGRHLASLDTGSTSPVRGIGWGTAVQQALSGGPSIVAMQSIINYHLNGDTQSAANMLASLGSLYSLESESLSAAALSTQAAIEVVASVGYANYTPQNGATYPEYEFAMALRQTAALARADVGLEVACIDLGGWDTHAQQGSVEGDQALLMLQLAGGLAAFHQDMGADMNRVTVVVMSEFGRRLAENASLGTDHGHGGALLLMSDNLSAAPVVANWVGLTPDVLDRGEDLPITTDYRDVLTEVLTRRLNNDQVNSVFPDYAPQSLNLFNGQMSSQPPA